MVTTPTALVHGITSSREPASTMEVLVVGQPGSIVTSTGGRNTSLNVLLGSNLHSVASTRSMGTSSIDGLMTVTLENLEDVPCPPNSSAQTYVDMIWESEKEAEEELQMGEARNWPTMGLPATTVPVGRSSSSNPGTHGDSELDSNGERTSEIEKRPANAEMSRASGLATQLSSVRATRFEASPKTPDTARPPVLLKNLVSTTWRWVGLSLSALLRAMTALMLWWL